MPTVKISDPPKPPCSHWDHKPPSMMVYDPGTYKHTCSACGAVTVFTVHGITCRS